MRAEFELLGNRVRITSISDHESDLVGLEGVVVPVMPLEFSLDSYGFGKPRLRLRLDDGQTVLLGERDEVEEVTPSASVQG